mmetsp:Transcript_6030/g.9838  ORF Transcript_6030/g.9838 Transcript_6030/m.9838 type:complete len:366 (+) Transcript_6030:148-1245(+)
MSFMMQSLHSADQVAVPTSSLLEPLRRVEHECHQLLIQEGITVVSRMPSLLGMTHASNLISFLVRKDLPLPDDDHSILSIVFLAPALLQSPDDNVVMATCHALVSVFDGSSAPTNISSTPSQALQLALERGVIWRLKELCHSSVGSDGARQAALCVLTTVLKADNPLHRLTVQQGGPRGFQLLESVLTQFRQLEGRDEQYDTSSRSEYYLHVLNCVSVLLLESSESKYADQLIRGDMHLLLMNIIKVNTQFEVASQVGRCLCSLLLNGSLEALEYMGPSVFPEVATGMVTSPDIHLVLLSLSSIWHLVQANHSFDFLQQTLCNEDFYNAVEGLTCSSVDEVICHSASLIIEYADELSSRRDNDMM